MRRTSVGLLWWSWVLLRGSVGIGIVWRAAHRAGLDDQTLKQQVPSPAVRTRPRLTPTGRRRPAAVLEDAVRVVVLVDVVASDADGLGEGLLGVVAGLLGAGGDGDGNLDRLFR